MCAVTVLTVCALTALTCARAGEASCDARIAATTDTEKSSREKSKAYLISTYGEDITLFCSGDTTDLAIDSEGHHLPTTRLNKTTIQTFVDKPCVGQYEYTCGSCKDTLIVIVGPAFFVRSPRMHHMMMSNGREKYFVPHGEVYQMYCSGVDLLIREESSMRPFQTETVNATTVKLEAQADKVGVYFYSCTSQGCDGDGKMSRLCLMVDSYPEAYNFKCVSYGRHWLKLECSWTSSSKINSFKLFLVKKYGRHQYPLCSYGPGALKRVCTSDNSEGTGSLLLQTCNEVFCDNRTHYFEDSAIVKLDAPTELQLLNRTSRSATVKWFSRFSWSQSEFKVEYRLLASTWRQVNTSAIIIPPYSDYCTLQLLLPCPDAHYEVRVYVRHTEALEDRFWSEPSSSLYFFTESGSGAVDGECNAVLHEPEPITSVETGLNEVGKLIRETMKERLKLKARVRDLKVKLDKIRALRDL